MAGGQGGTATCSFVWAGWVTWHQHTNTGEEVRSCFYIQVDTGGLTMVLVVESDITFVQLTSNFSHFKWCKTANTQNSSKFI